MTTTITSASCRIMSYHVAFPPNPAMTTAIALLLCCIASNLHLTFCNNHSCHFCFKLSPLSRNYISDIRENQFNFVFSHQQQLLHNQFHPMILMINLFWECTKTLRTLIRWVKDENQRNRRPKTVLHFDFHGFSPLSNRNVMTPIKSDSSQGNPSSESAPETLRTWTMLMKGKKWKKRWSQNIGAIWLPWIQPTL